MADPVPTPEPTPPATKKGVVTVLHDRIVLNAFMSIIGVVAAAATELGAKYANVDDPKVHYLAGFFAVVGLLLKNPTLVNALLAKVFGAALAFLLLASPAHASGPFVNCLSGCPKVSTADVKLKLGEPTTTDVPLTATVWVGPSLGLVPALYDSASKTWAVGFHPTFGYGVGWRPAGWTATKSLAKLDLFLSADFGGAGRVDVLPGVTLIDGIQVIGGPRFNFASASSASSVSWLFGIGFGTSLGTP